MPHTDDLKSFFEKRILVVCGSGGVGKTTVSAALALEAASRGKKTLVLTIDPAKRLAQVLGISKDASPSSEPPPQKGGGLMEGKLTALMLNTQRTFDRLIQKYAPPASRETILKNRLYQHLSNMISGSQEYMAMEKVYELHQEAQQELIVVDTPPTRHALDFLEAPQRMVRLTSASLVKWLARPGRVASRMGQRFFGAFHRLAGAAFLEELSEMLGLFAGLLGGFQERAEAVSKLLQQKEVGFLLITSPEAAAVQDALYFLQKIQAAGLPFLGFIVNRSHLEFLGKSPPIGVVSSSLKKKLLKNFENYVEVAEKEKKTIELLRKTAGEKTPCLLIPALTEDVHDLKGLDNLRSLFQAPASTYS